MLQSTHRTLLGLALLVIGGCQGPVALCEGLSGSVDTPLPGDRLCDEVVLINDETVCTDPGCPAPGVQDLDALDCALTALVERTPGYLTWAVNPGEPFERAGYLLIGEDGDVVMRRWSQDDLELSAGPATYGEAEPPSYYQDCLDNADEQDRFDCLLTPLREELEQCVSGYSESQY